jgi:hypothetical protein
VGVGSLAQAGGPNQKEAQGGAPPPGRLKAARIFLRENATRRKTVQHWQFALEMGRRGGFLFGIKASRMRDYPWFHLIQFAVIAFFDFLKESA